MAWQETQPRGLGPEEWDQRDEGRDVSGGSQWLQGPRWEEQGEAREDPGPGCLGAWVGWGRATVSSLDFSSKPLEDFKKLGWVVMWCAFRVLKDFSARCVRETYS